MAIKMHGTTYFTRKEAREIIVRAGLNDSEVIGYVRGTEIGHGAHACFGQWHASAIMIQDGIEEYVRIRLKTTRYIQKRTTLQRTSGLTVKTTHHVPDEIPDAPGIYILWPCCDDLSAARIDSGVRPAKVGMSLDGIRTRVTRQIEMSWPIVVAWIIPPLVRQSCKWDKKSDKQRRKYLLDCESVATRVWKPVVSGCARTMSEMRFDPPWLDVSDDSAPSADSALNDRAPASALSADSAVSD